MLYVVSSNFACQIYFTPQKPLRQLLENLAGSHLITTKKSFTQEVSTS